MSGPESAHRRIAEANNKAGPKRDDHKLSWKAVQPDANEVVEAWRVIAAFRHEPVARILTRQAVPTLDRTKYAAAEGLRRGACILADADDGRPHVLLLATGSEVALCVEAYETLKAEGIKARVVSMPSWEMFEHYCRAHPEYREQVLRGSVGARVSVEQGSTLGWARYVGRRGHSIGMETFGASAPIKELQKKFGFTPDNVISSRQAADHGSEVSDARRPRLPRPQG